VKEGHKKQSTIDRKRDAAISLRVGDDTDRSPLKKMIGFAESIYVFRDESVWKIQLADAIDPERTNSNIPNAQQREIDIGLNSELVRRTVIQVDELVKPDALGSDGDRDRVLTLALRSLHALRRLERVREALLAHQISAQKELREDGPSRTLTLPCYPGLNETWSSVLESTETVRKCCREIAFSFFPSCARGETWLDSFFSLIRERMPASSEGFSGPYDEINQLLALVRWIRNRVEHPKESEFITISDYRLSKDGHVDAPMIKLTGHKKFSGEITLAQMVREFLEGLLYCFESILVLCCLSHLRRDGVFEREIIQRSSEEAKARQLGIFGYAVELGGTLRELS
jgi:hypothetical protein